MSFLRLSGVLDPSGAPTSAEVDIDKALNNALAATKVLDARSALGVQDYANPVTDYAVFCAGATPDHAEMQKCLDENLFVFIPPPTGKRWEFP